MVSAPPPSRRLLAIDALRGLALALMALDHVSYLVRVNVVAEDYAGVAQHLSSWPYVVIGLFTNLAAPAFWALSGISIGLLTRQRLARGESEWSVSRFLLIRAAILILIDLSVDAVARGTDARVAYGYVFDVLSSLAVSMAMMSVLRRLPVWLLLGLMLSLLAGYQELIHWILRGQLDSSRYWTALWLTYSSHTHPRVWFPVLGWIGLMGVGYALGRYSDAPSAGRPRTWALGGIALLSLWISIRSGCGYGCFVPFQPGEPWWLFFVMSKGPPSLDYLSFNLGLACLVFAAFKLRPQWLERPPLRWLVALGQASLFIYVAHLVVFRLLAPTSLALVPNVVPRMPRFLMIWVVGLAILIPLAGPYRALRARHRDSVLRYL